MTSTRQHIEDLDPEKWAALTKRAADAAVQAGQRLGRRPPPELVAATALSERELVEHRARGGPAQKRKSAVMRLVAADHLRVLAENQAREADQNRQDAEARTAVARDEADESARAVASAREETRAAQTRAARIDRDRGAAGIAAQKVLEEVRAELERVRAESAAELAKAREQVSAAQERAEERIAERAAEKATAEHAAELLRGELERVRADATAEVAAATEQANAADERAQQRMRERAAEKAAAQQELEEVRGELERVRADATADVAAARGQASGEIAAAHRSAQDEVSRARAEAAEAVAGAQAEVQRIRADAESEIAAARQTAQAEVAQARAEAEEARFASAAQVVSGQLLTIPVPSPGVRKHAGRIEDALLAVRQVDYLLEAEMAEGTTSRVGVDVGMVRSLLRTVQEQARDLSQELRDLPSRCDDQRQAEAAGGYARAAASAYGGFLQRITTATERLARRDDPADTEVVALVIAMLSEHPWRRR
jgi:colicin import membrane protein